MRNLLREWEANQLALLLVLLGFLFVLLVVYIIANTWFNVDGSTILGLAGMGTGSHGVTATNQALQARSPNYQPLITQPGLPPLPTSAPPGAHV